jgi:hypothetical protein
VGTPTIDGDGTATTVRRAGEEDPVRIAGSGCEERDGSWPTCGGARVTGKGEGSHATRSDDSSFNFSAA